MKTQAITEEKAVKPSMRADIPLVVALVQGLLASGHYTSPDDDEDGPSVQRVDYGKDWKDCGVDRRRPAQAVEDALDLLQEIKAALSPTEPNL